jgi:hypothetical protein
MGRKSKTSMTRGHRVTPEKNMRRFRRARIKKMLQYGPMIPGCWQYHFHRHLNARDFGDRFISIVNA